MEELRSWFEIPVISHYFQIFRKSFQLIGFNIEDFEEALLLDSVENVTRDEDVHSSIFIPVMVIRLLKGLYRHEIKDELQVTLDNYDHYLGDLLNIHYGKSKRKNPLSNSTFKDLRTRKKVEILYDMINWRLYCDDATVLTRDLDAEVMRIEPVGRDKYGNIYWYFYGSRLYKEASHAHVKEEPVNESEELRNGKSKKNSKNVKPWSLICSTVDEWEVLLKKLQGTKSKDENQLLRNLDEIYEKIPSIIKRRDAHLRKELRAMMVPTRVSDRLTYKIQQQEAEEMLREQEAKEEERQEEERQVRLETEMLEEQKKQYASQSEQRALRATFRGAAQPKREGLRVNPKVAKMFTPVVQNSNFTAVKEGICGNSKEEEQGDISMPMHSLNWLINFKI